MNQKKKRIIIATVSVVVFLVVVVAAILIGSIMAVSNFRNSASRQFNQVITENKTNVVSPTKLIIIPLADVLNPTYKRVDSAQSTYQKLLNNARKYNLIKQCQTQLTELYNAHLVDDGSLTGNVLALAQSCLSTVTTNYPTETTVKSDLKSLVTLIGNSTTFSQIESKMSTVINDQVTWLDQLETDLNAESASFQKAVN